MRNIQDDNMKRGTPRHPKTQELADVLGISLYAAVGLLELLWHFAAEFSPRGDVGKFSDKRIEAALHWDGKTGALIAAFVATGWLDSVSEYPHIRLLVHDWQDHCEQSVEKKLKRANESFLSIRGEVDGQKLSMDSLARGYGSYSSNNQKNSSSLPEKISQDFPEGFDVWVDSVFSRWGKIKNRILGEQALARIFSEGFDRQSFEHHFGSWCAYYAKLGWNFAPSLAEWIEDGGHKRKAPPIPRKSTAQNDMYGGGSE